MKNQIFLINFILNLVIYSVFAQTSVPDSCLDFDSTPGVLANWLGYKVTNIHFPNAPSHGNVLSFTDASGPSMVFNNVDFTGDWLSKAIDGCFCFDYKIDWNSTVPTSAVYGPGVSLYNGPPMSTVAFGLRAAFVPASGPPIQDNVWHRCCLPIAPCIAGSLPSNTYGTWVLTNNGAAVPASAVCNLWNTLISNVTGIALGADYNSQPSEISNYDNFCWHCDSTAVDSTCCPGENLISNGGFENGNTGFTSGYSYQTPPSANSVMPGMYAILNSSDANTVSPTWDVDDHTSACTSPAGKFMVVNGATGQPSGPRLVWEQNVGVQPNKDYRFCAWFRDLKQCAFNVLPNVEIRLTLPAASPIISNTIINTANANPCDWQLVSHAINTGSSSTLNIQIWLDEGPDGDGNDLAIDDINLKQMSLFAPGAAQFNVTTTWTNTTSFSITATPNSPAFPPANATGCGYFWEVCEVDNSGNCLPGTTVTNPSQWWTGATSFPGYNGTGNLTTTPSGVFLIGHRYKIRYGIWCDCYSWSQSVLIIEYNTRMQRLLITEEKEATPTGSR